jgi:glycosyltransferase involved in cell wall biosynthesis
MHRTVLFIIDGLSGGGAEKVVLTLAEGMARQGLRVVLVSLRPVCAYPVPDGVEFVQLEDRYHGPFHRQTEIMRRSADLDLALRTRFRDGEIDLVVSNLPKCDRIVAACAFLADAWFCLHNSLVIGQLGRCHGLRRWLKLLRLRRTYSGRKLITVSRALELDIQACGIVPQQWTAIYNPFDIDAIRAQSRQPCRMENESFLLHVGRFHRQKRHDRLLEAFKLSGFPGKLVLLGDGMPGSKGQILACAQQLGIESRIVLPGFVANPFPYMRCAQALLLSSDHEGFGNCIVEAMICGTPVVSTDCEHGPREILTGELARGLCALEPAAMAQAINAVLESPPAIDENSLRRFAVEHVVSQYLALLTPCRKARTLPQRQLPDHAESNELAESL